MHILHLITGVLTVAISPVVALDEVESFIRLKRRGQDDDDDR